MKKRRASHSPSPIHHLTKHHRYRRTDKRRHYRRCNHCCRIHTAVLLPVYNHIDRNQLQRRYVKYKKITHLFRRRPLSFTEYHIFLTCSHFRKILRIPRSASNFASSSIALRPPCVKLMTRIFLIFGENCCCLSDKEYLTPIYKLKDNS